MKLSAKRFITSLASSFTANTPAPFALPSVNIKPIISRDVSVKFGIALACNSNGMSVAKSILPSSVIRIRGVNPSVPYISAETPVTSSPIFNSLFALSIS